MYILYKPTSPFQTGDFLFLKMISHVAKPKTWWHEVWSLVRAAESAVAMACMETAALRSAPRRLEGNWPQKLPSGYD